MNFHWIKVTWILSVLCSYHCSPQLCTVPYGSHLRQLRMGKDFFFKKAQQIFFHETQLYCFGWTTIHFICCYRIGHCCCDTCTGTCIISSTTDKHFTNLVSTNRLIQFRRLFLMHWSNIAVCLPGYVMYTAQVNVRLCGQHKLQQYQ